MSWAQRFHSLQSLVSSSTPLKLTVSSRHWQTTDGEVPAFSRSPAGRQTEVEIIAAPDSSWSPQQVLGWWTQAMGEEEMLVPDVSLSPAHTFKLRWTVVRRKGMDGLDPGDSLIPTRLHCHQDCSLYWDGLIPGTKPPGPAERDSFLLVWRGFRSRPRDQPSF